jgi:hypothetical protein
MLKIITFFKEASPLKLLFLAVPFLVVSLFIEKSFPSIFIFARLTTFMLVIFAVIRFLNAKF